MRGGGIRYLEKGLDVCFVRGRHIVFLENGCSNPLECLLFSKIVVPTPWNVCFSQKWLFQPLGTSVFLKNGCSNPLERLFFSKTDENGGRFRLFFLKTCEKGLRFPLF